MNIIIIEYIDTSRVAIICFLLALFTYFKQIRLIIDAIITINNDIIPGNNLCKTFTFYTFCVI